MNKLSILNQKVFSKLDDLILAIHNMGLPRIWVIRGALFLYFIALLLNFSNGPLGMVLGAIMVVIMLVQMKNQEDYTKNPKLYNTAILATRESERVIMIRYGLLPFWLSIILANIEFTNIFYVLSWITFDFLANTIIPMEPPKKVVFNLVFQ